VSSQVLRNGIIANWLPHDDRRDFSGLEG